MWQFHRKGSRYLFNLGIIIKITNLRLQQNLPGASECEMSFIIITLGGLWLIMQQIDQIWSRTRMWSAIDRNMNPILPVRIIQNYHRTMQHVGQKTTYTLFKFSTSVHEIFPYSASCWYHCWTSKQQHNHLSNRPTRHLSIKWAIILINI